MKSYTSFYVKSKDFFQFIAFIRHPSSFAQALRCQLQKSSAAFLHAIPVGQCSTLNQSSFTQLTFLTHWHPSSFANVLPCRWQKSSSAFLHAIPVGQRCRFNQSSFTQLTFLIVGRNRVSDSRAGKAISGRNRAHEVMGFSIGSRFSRAYSCLKRTLQCSAISCRNRA